MTGGRSAVAGRRRSLVGWRARRRIPRRRRRIALRRRRIALRRSRIALLVLAGRSPPLAGWRVRWRVARRRRVVLLPRRPARRRRRRITHLFLAGGRVRRWGALRLGLLAGEQKSARKNEQHADESENEPPPRAQLLQVCTVANTRQYPVLCRPNILGSIITYSCNIGLEARRRFFAKMGRMAHVTILYQMWWFLPKMSLFCQNGPNGPCGETCPRLIIGKCAKAQPHNDRIRRPGERPRGCCGDPPHLGLGSDPPGRLRRPGGRPGPRAAVAR